MGIHIENQRAESSPLPSRTSTLPFNHWNEVLGIFQELYKSITTQTECRADPVQ